MLGEDVAPLELTPEPLVHLAGQVELLLEPEGKAHHEELEAPRRIGDIGFENAVEFEQGLVVEGHEVESHRGESPPRRGNTRRHAPES